MSQIKKLLHNEPVAFFGALQTLWLAVLALAAAFSWWTWSDPQQAAVSGVWAAVTALLTFLIRGRVTPSDPVDRTSTGSTDSLI